jgi:hypothetical protein
MAGGGTARRAERRVATVDGKQPTVWLLGMILTISGLACTSAQHVGPSPRRKAASEACFNVRTIDSFSPLHEMFVYLRELDGKQYLLTLDRIYTSLPFATGITVSSTFGRVCSNTGAMITYTNLGNRVSCRIVRVEAVPSKEAAMRIVRERTPRRPTE